MLKKYCLVFFNNFQVRFVLLHKKDSKKLSSQALVGGAEAENWDQTWKGEDSTCCRPEMQIIAVFKNCLMFFPNLLSSC